MRITLCDTISRTDEAARAFLEGEGFGLARHFWRMRIEMDEMPPAPKLQRGITIRTFVPTQDDCATFEAMEEAFQDH